MKKPTTSTIRPATVATVSIATAVSALAMVLGPDLVFARLATNHNETAAVDPPA